MLGDGPGATPPVSDVDFGSLIERARGAHNAEVEGLRLEVQGLRRELLAALGQLGERAASGGREEAGDTLPEVRAHSKDDQTTTSTAVDDQRTTTSTTRGRPDDDDFNDQRTTRGRPSVSGGPALSKDDRSMSVPSMASSVSGGSGPGSLESGGDSRRSLKSRRSSGLRHSTTRQKQERKQNMLEKGRLWGLVTGPAFEAVVAVAILANALVLIVEAQYKSFTLATSTGHGSAVGESVEVWPIAEDIFHVLSWAFGIVFSLELALKIAGLRFEFFTDVWNWVDAIVAMVWLFSEVSQLDANAGFLRIARLARLVRLVRILKILRAHHSDGLFMMVTALTGSISTTLWCFLFVLMVHMLLALGMNQFLQEVYFDPDSPKAREQILVYEYFGSFTRAFLTMFEMTFGDFVNPTRILIEHVDEAFILFAVVYKTIFGFAVIGVLNAVFVQETFKAASLDDNLMVRQQKENEYHHRRRMHQLFEDADADGDGTLDLDEWVAVCQDEWVQVWLASMGIEAEDAQSLFELLDTGNGKVTAEEIVKGTASLKGASAMMTVLAMVRRIDARVKNISAELLFLQLPSPQSACKNLSRASGCSNKRSLQLSESRRVPL